MEIVDTRWSGNYYHLIEVKPGRAHGSPEIVASRSAGGGRNKRRQGARGRRRASRRRWGGRGKSAREEAHM